MIFLFQIDVKFGFEPFTFENTNGNESQQVREKRGWLFNMLPTTVRIPFFFLKYNRVYAMKMNE